MGFIEKHDKGETHRKDFELTGAGARREEGVKMRFLGKYYGKMMLVWKWGVRERMLGIGRPHVHLDCCVWGWDW